MPAPTTWPAFLHLFQDCFTLPSYVLFEQLLTAWPLCPGRHTLTRLWSVIPAGSRRPYGAYARLIRDGRWSMDRLWARLARLLVERWVGEGVVTALLDDTLAKKTGRHIEGAGYFRDAVHSTASYTVTAWGLNIVVLALCVTPPWQGEPLALPLLIRVHRKDELSLVDLAVTMIWQLHRWLPDHRIRVVADGAYASLVGYQWPPTVHIVSRIRSNAALYDPPPPRTGRRGRPRLRGQRLPSPRQLAAGLAEADWTTSQVHMRTHLAERLVFARKVLWYEAARSRPLLLVIVRVPDGNQPPDFLITTDVNAAPETVASAYDHRWPIEDTNRNVKQFLGAEDPQSWVREGPERVLSLACWLYSAVCHWFADHAQEVAWPHRPWYASKSTPSFTDALATLRRQCWTAAFSARSAHEPVQPEILTTLLAVLAEAA